MSKRKGEELAGPSRKKTTSQAGTSSRVSEEEEEDEINLTQRADFEINSVCLTKKNLVATENNEFHINSLQIP